MSKSIVFISPPYSQVAPGYEWVRHISDKSPSLGLLYLAAQAREDGYDPTIIESEIQCLDAAQTVEVVAALQPAYVGITLFTIGVWNAVEIARGLKRALPETKILVGGPHISSMGMETMSRFPEFDLAVVGEGERTLSRVLSGYRADGELGRIPGIIYRDAEGRLRRTAAGPIEKSLDRLPLPAWDLLPGFPHAYPATIYDFPQGPVATLATSRGCPFHCRFCDTSTFGNRVRSYSPAKVFEMMEHLKVHYGVRHILFVDDLFLANRKRAANICTLLIEHRLGLTWSCLSRVDSVHPDLLRLMKQAGCWEIAFGLESGSDELLRRMGKSAETEKARQALNWTAKAGIRTKGLFMLGYPGESEDTIAQTKSFIRRLPLDVMFLTKFTPYPGSPVYLDLYGTRIREDHWNKMNGMSFVWESESLSMEVLDRHYQELFITFYRRLVILRVLISMSWRYPDHVFRLMRFGREWLVTKLRASWRSPKF